MAATSTKHAIWTLTETLIMNMLTAASLVFAALTVVVTAITTARSATARTNLDRPIPRAIPAAVATRIRRQAMRASRVSRPIRRVRPQYLPALARARILRLQTSHLAITTPRRHHTSELL